MSASGGTSRLPRAHARYGPASRRAGGWLAEAGRGWPRLAEAGCMRLGAAPGILWRWWSLLGATLADAGPPWFRQSGVRAAAGQV